MMLKRLGLLTALGLTLFSAAAAAQTSMHLRGNVDLLFGDILELTTRTGEKVSVTLEDATHVLAVSKMALTDIKPGSSVGIASAQQPDGSLRALEVTIIPPGQPLTPMNGPWDLTPSSRMTNGTVGTVTGTTSRTLTVNYGKGDQTIVVPATAPVVTLGRGDRSMLAPGVAVVVFAHKETDNTITAGAVAVGKDGVVPPM